MTVGDLIDALRHTPRTRTVWITFAKEDERRATCIIDSGRDVHIIDTNEEIHSGEKILFDENKKDESE